MPPLAARAREPLVTLSTDTSECWLEVLSLQRLPHKSVSARLYAQTRKRAASPRSERKVSAPDVWLFASLQMFSLENAVSRVYMPFVASICNLYESQVVNRA